MTDDATYRNMKQERDLALSECERLRTRHWTILDDMNKSELDAYDLGCAESIAAVDKILDGKDDGSGTNNEPWYTQRKRLLSLTAECERLRAVLRDTFSVRDHFAGMAMQGVILGALDRGPEYAYKVADTMLAARTKP